MLPSDNVDPCWDHGNHRDFLYLWKHLVKKNITDHLQWDCTGFGKLSRSVFKYQGLSGLPGNNDPCPPIWYWDLDYRAQRSPDTGQISSMLSAKISTERISGLVWFVSDKASLIRDYGMTANNTNENPTLNNFKATSESSNWFGNHQASCMTKHYCLWRDQEGVCFGNWHGNLF